MGERELEKFKQIYHPKIEEEKKQLSEGNDQLPCFKLTRGFWFSFVFFQMYHLIALRPTILRHARVF